MHVELQIARLDPQHVYASWKLHHKTWDYGPPGFTGGGLDPGVPAGAAMWAGFDYFEDGGTFSGELKDYVFRGGVQFNLDQPGPGLPEGFAKAAGRERYMLLNAALTFFRQEPHDNCETYVYVANGDWAGGVLDHYLIPTTGLPADYVDTIPPFVGEGGSWPADPLIVTDRVQSWLNGASNYGFCFMGPDETMPEDTRSRRCVNQFGAFKLELRYLTFSDGAGADHITPVKPRIQHPSQRVAHTTVVGRLPESFSERLRRPVPHNRRPPRQ
jgi:hypothetical protein